MSPHLFSFGSSVGLATRFPVRMADPKSLDLTDNAAGRHRFNLRDESEFVLFPLHKGAGAVCFERGLAV